jgi:serine protease Do
VESGAPAEKAGIEAGDIITKFEGRAIDKASDLPRMVGNIKPGTKATVTVFRRGVTKDVVVTIAEVEAEKPARPASSTEPKAPVAGPAQALGLSVSEPTDAQKKELKIKGGVKVDAVEGAAARAGLREGDVIVSMANAEVTGVGSFEAALAKIEKSKSVTVLVRRGELAQFLIIKPAR